MLVSTDLTLKNLFLVNEKLTFLVGAGCSVDHPSNLPAGFAMMKAIIAYTCAETEFDKIYGLRDLRFEQLVEIVRDNLDKELKIIDYYGKCNKPNLQHFFLASMIKSGHFLMTTNFDFLIEHALLQSNVPKEDVIPVITKKDFQFYSNPNALLKDKKNAIYKIHGSTKNIITGEDTRDSLIATIQAFGSNKEGENVFQVEPFKRPLFNNISKGRTIVVIGYSGSDDFDVVPTLKILKDIYNIIWINFVRDDEGHETIFEVKINSNTSISGSNKVNQILSEIKQMNHAQHVYLVNANTTRLLNNLLDFKPNIDSDTFSLNPIDWLKENVEKPDEFVKYYIPYKIYYDFDMYGDAMRCTQEILRLAEAMNNIKYKSLALNNIGDIYRVQGQYGEAIEYYERSLKIYNQFEALDEKASVINNIGETYRVQGKFSEAIKWYEEAVKIAEQIGNIDGKATILNNIGLINYTQGNYFESLKKFEEALRIYEQLGNLNKKATVLNNIGSLLRMQGEYSKALNQFDEAVKIAEQLGNLSLKATCLNNIGLIHYTQGRYPEAVKHYEEVLSYVEQLGDLSTKTFLLNNIGEVFRLLGDYDQALKRYEEALKITENLGNLNSKAMSLINIGHIYHLQKKYSEAMNSYDIALNIVDQLGDLSSKSTVLNNIGETLRAQGNYTEALRNYEIALEITNQLGNRSLKATNLNNIGLIYHAQKNFTEALKKYNEALNILEELGDLTNKAAILNNMGETFKAQDNFSEAIHHYKESLKCLRQLGLGDSPNANTVQKNIENIKKKMK